jgi:hypothetical protein
MQLISNMYQRQALLAGRPELLIHAAPADRQRLGLTGQ